jgi:hypothetical protein
VYDFGGHLGAYLWQAHGAHGGAIKTAGPLWRWRWPLFADHRTRFEVVDLPLLDR